MAGLIHLPGAVASLTPLPHNCGDGIRLTGAPGVGAIWIAVTVATSIGTDTDTDRQALPGNDRHLPFMGFAHSWLGHRPLLHPLLHRGFDKPAYIRRYIVNLRYNFSSWKTAVSRW